MNRAELDALIAATVKKLAPEADLGALADSDDLREALDIDSYDFMRLITALAEAAGRQVPEKDYAKLATRAGLRAYFAP